MKNRRLRGRTEGYTEGRKNGRLRGIKNGYEEERTATRMN